MRLAFIYFVALIGLISCTQATVFLPQVYTLQMSGDATSTVGFSTYTYYVAQMSGNYIARSDSVDDEFVTSEYSFWDGKQGSPVKHFTVLFADSGKQVCTMEETFAEWSAPIPIDALEFSAHKAPGAAYQPMDLYILNYTSSGRNFVDSWYFWQSEVPIYMSSRDVATGQGQDFVISFKTPKIDDLKPFLELPAICNNASNIAQPVTHHRFSQRRVQAAPTCNSRQSRCCVYLKDTLVLHNNIRNLPACPPMYGGQAKLCNERCITNFPNPDASCNRVMCA